jgi:hypothetical protein
MTPTPPQSGRPTRRTLLAALALSAAAGIARPARAVPPTAAEDGTPDPARRILVVGDSQAQGLAGGFMRRYRRDRDIHVIDRSKISTGLMPRANYDWPVQIKSIAQTEHADVAVVMFGANDRPQVRAHGGLDDGRVAAFREDYGAKVAAIVTPLREAHMPVIWVGHPIVRDPTFSQDMELLDSIYQQAASAAGAVYVPTWDLFAGPDGAYSAYGPGLDGQTTRLRADDGVHLTVAGYDVLARMLEPRIREVVIQAQTPAGTPEQGTQAAPPPSPGVPPPTANAHRN